MYMMPYVNNLLDDFKHPFEDIWRKANFHSDTKNIMSTDVVEKGNEMELTVELPGVKKDNIKVELDQGYLSITASSNEEKEEKDDSRNYIRKERFSGTYTRSFFVGDDVKEEDIKAKFENGILTVNFPKEKQSEIESKKTISIEG